MRPPVIRSLGLFLAIGLTALAFTTPFQNLSTIPDQLRLFSGEVHRYSWTVPAVTASSDSEVVSIQETENQEMAITSRTDGSAKIQFKLFNRIPVKTTEVQVFAPLHLIPGGQSIGVELHSAGIMVVGFHQVTEKEKTASPGEQANIKVGDLILKVNGERVENTQRVSELIQKSGQTRLPLELELARGKEIYTTRMYPVFDEKSKAYRVGLYIRDSAAGVGTLTFYDPQHQVYGALGHVITDMDTQKPITVGEGTIYPSQVTDIERGASGEPGQKRAFFRSDHPIGTIEKNTPFGIFGRMEKTPPNGLISEAMEVGLSEEVRRGPAEMLTVVDGKKVESYDIEIVDIFPQRYPATKGMIIKVTDEVLLKKTGGIIQGMSGSPIIQDGKLIGAVTHVFVNDPTSGYATFIEWMLKDAEILKDGATALSSFVVCFLFLFRRKDFPRGR